MSVNRARTPEEYTEWVKQMKFEVEDLKQCLLYEEEDIGNFPIYLEPLEWGINQLYDAMCNSEYSFGREDLPFMEVANVHANEIPFYQLLQQINETHRKGLDVGEEN